MAEVTIFMGACGGVGPNGITVTINGTSWISTDGIYRKPWWSNLDLSGLVQTESGSFLSSILKH